MLKMCIERLKVHAKIILIQNCEKKIAQITSAMSLVFETLDIT